jgi:serine/threonine protein kinase
VLRRRTLLKGRYEVRELVATGGMGTIWRGHDVELGRDVAIKMMRDDVALDQAAFARFRHEATVLAGLQHPGITVVHDFEGKKAPFFIVMEFLRGKDLAAIMKDNSRGLPVERAVRYAAEAADALAAAHAESVLHADIKPANLFVLKQDNRIKLCDFGIAATIGDQGLAADPGWRAGTCAYMAPEQWEGEATASSDLYALGCVLHEMLTGRAPFPASLGEKALRELHLMLLPRAPRSLLDTIPDDLSDLVLRLLAKKPQGRPASASELAAELRATLATPDARRHQGELRTRVDQLDKPHPGRTRPARAGVAAVSAPGTALLPPPTRALPSPDRPLREQGRGLTQRGWAIRAVRLLAWLLFLTAAVLSVGIGSLHWAPMSRLYLLVPMAIFTLPGALARYAGLGRVRDAVLGGIALCIAEAGSLVFGLFATRPTVLEASAVLAVLAWCCATLSTGSVLRGAD